jgi:hypothetical protein
MISLLVLKIATDFKNRHTRLVGRWTVNFPFAIKVITYSITLFADIIIRF